MNDGAVTVEESVEHCSSSEELESVRNGTFYVSRGDFGCLLLLFFVIVGVTLDVEFDKSF